MQKPKFKRGEYVYFIGRHSKKIEYVVVDSFYNDKIQEYKYLLRGLKHPFRRKERIESNIKRLN